MRKPFFLLFFFISFYLLNNAQAVPLTFQVNRTTDAYSNNPDCTQLANNCSLREAIIAANNRANQASPDNPHTIILKAGEIYQLTLPDFDPTTDENNAVTGDLDIQSDINIKVEGKGLATIDGGGRNGTLGHRIFDVTTNHVLNISQMKITGGYYPPPTSADTSGAIKNDGKIYLSEVILQNNIGTCGGIQASPTAQTTLDKVSVIDNRGSHTGGICNSGTLTITNSTFSGNNGEPLGNEGAGAIYSSIETGALSLLNNTIVFNEPIGITIAANKNISIKNNLLSNNKDRNCNLRGLIAISSGNNLETGNSCGFKEASKDLINIQDAKLGPLAENGGLTPTYALLPGSPAIGAGKNCPDTDQRGFSRKDKPCDIGAYQVDQSSETGKPSPSSNTSSSGGCSLSRDSGINFFYLFSFFNLVGFAVLRKIKD